MDNFLKIMLGINCILYKKYDYTLLNYIIFIFNTINFLSSYSLVLYFIYSLFSNYKIEYLLLVFYYIIDFIIIYNSNKIVYLKVLGRNLSLYLDNRSKRIIKILQILSLIFSLLIAGFGIYINNISNFNFINNNLNIYFNNYALFFLIFYSSYTKINILILFFSIISNIIKFLDDFIQNKIKDNSNYNIDELSIEYLVLKRNYNKTIYAFNDIISNIIAFSSIPSFYLITNLISIHFDFMYYFGFIYFIIFSLIFHYYLSKIDDNIEYLNSICSKNRSLHDYIKRKKNIYSFETNSIDLNNINMNELSFKNYIIDIENAQTIDWLIFDKIINRPWRAFEIFGLKINNSNIIIKMCSLFIILIIGKQIM